MSAVPFSDAPLLPALGAALRRRVKAFNYQFEAGIAPRARQLIVDVSVIIQHDAGTGIQRVVRALLGQLAGYDGPNLVVQPVFASRDHGYCLAGLTSDGRIVNPACAQGMLQPVVARRGDIFLGLDLAAHLLPRVEADLARWRRTGVAINIMVYDLLPLLQPEWFPARTVRNFNRWVGVLARQADRCICISGTVAQALAGELAARGLPSLPDIQTIPLGSDLAASYPSVGLPDAVASLRTWLQSHRAILSVGTIEPRKGHRQVLAALSHHWQAAPESNVGLLLVGRPGWKTSDLQAQLLAHPERGKRLIWLEAASDELLAEIYGSVAGLVAASLGEGFGLPLIEALAHGTPVLARDLPVFREIGGDMLDYFDNDAPDALAQRLLSWLHAARRPTQADLASLPRWSDSARALARWMSLPSHGNSQGGSACP